MIDDNLGFIFEEFDKDRTSHLRERFHGPYVGEVVETNDPLNMRRIRVRIPELHDRELKPEDCPWARTLDCFNSNGVGEFRNFCINDLVLILFEKGHPYSLICIGSLPSTRRKSYVLESIYVKSPVSVNTEGEIDSRPSDFNENYLPKDNRPMSSGNKDRYGSIFELNSIGFFPKEHDTKSSPNGTDNLTGGDFESSQLKPEQNVPDTKYCNILTKYGNMFLLNDVGYQWFNEFSGDFKEDEQFEIKRNNYYRKFLNEDKTPNGDGNWEDQRRVSFITRYGHKFEMRDTGWNKTRKKEFTDESVTISDSDKDLRWIKLKTKSGHLLQLIDKGYDSENNININKLLIDDVGESDFEDEWDDSRQIRLISAHGNKIVLDDIGADKVDPVDNETSGNGILIRTKKGFSIDLNDREKTDRLLVTTPGNQVLEINDKYKYILLTTEQEDGINEEYDGLKKNEFHRKNGVLNNPIIKTFHLKLDSLNKNVRLKSPSLQGFELRDGANSWSEINSEDDRGVFFSSTDKVSIFRGASNPNPDRYVSINDDKKNIIIRNEDGVIFIYGNSVNIVAKNDIKLKGRNIELLAENSIKLGGGGGKLLINGAMVGSNKKIVAPELNGFLPGALFGPGTPNAAQTISTDMTPPNILSETSFKPIDRGYDENFGTYEELNEDYFKI